MLFFEVLPLVLPLKATKKCVPAKESAVEDPPCSTARLEASAVLRAGRSRATEMSDGP